VRSAVLTAFRIVGLGLAFALQLSWLAQPLPLVVKLLPASLFVLSVVRPDHGLLVLAGLGPMANAIGTWFHSPLPGIRLLEQLILALVSGAGLRWWRGPDSTRLADPAALVAASAAASCIAVQPALLIQRMPEVTFWAHLRTLLQNGDYFVRSGLWDPLFFASLTIEGVALAVTAERIVRRVPASALGALRMAVAGHAGVAALNLQQVIGAAIRAGDAWRQLPRVVRDVRVSLFYDVNAAGSVFLLILLAGVGLLRTAARLRWEIAVVLLLIALGLWLAGSRAAFVALAATLVAMLSATAWKRAGTVRWIALAAIAGILIAGGLASILYPSARNVALGTASSTRRILMETSVNMWRSAPVFGVGIGRFYEESVHYGADALVTAAETAGVRENAHNNFLQVLATEGLVGLAALLITLGVVLVAALRTAGGAAGAQRRWLTAGIAGYLLTWLFGHPQLVPEAAFAFWMLLGVLAGMLPSPTYPRSRLALPLIAALVLVSAPFRAAAAIRQMDFEHVAIGVSPWQPALDGIRYRAAPVAFGLYLPADGTAVDLPLRRAPGAADPLAVAIILNGRKLYEPLVSGNAWQQIRVQLPKTNRRFARVEFEVSPPQSDGKPVLLVGKDERR